MPYRSRYSQIAKMYDGDYAVFRTPSGDVQFYVEEAQRSGGPVLEFGCGTGRTLIPIADAGIEAVGLDNSEPMLEQARAKSDHVEWICGDMCSTDLGRQFALVTIPFRAIGHVLSVEDQLATFANAKRHLAPGGRFIFDVFNPNPAFMVEPKVDVLNFEREEDGKKVRRYSSTKHDRSTQITEVVFRWEIESADGAIEELREEFDMRWYYRFELEHLLARAGLEIEALWGNFDRSDVVAESPEFIFVARNK